MSSFTVKANMYLRQVYSPNRSLVSANARAEVSNNTLSSADSIALKKSIRNLADYDYDANEDDVLDTTKANFTYKLHNFVDSYNYTLQSSKNSDNIDISRTGAKMKKLSKQYEDELKECGISINSDGYLSVSSTATSNVDLSSFGDLCSSDSKYMSQLKKYASTIHNHVDLKG